MVRELCLLGVGVSRKTARMSVRVDTDDSYADWISLNEPRLVMLRRVVHGLDLATYKEAVGDLMYPNLVIVKEEDLDPNLPPLHTSLPTSSRFPPIYFEGRNGDEPLEDDIDLPHVRVPSQIRGVVRLTADEPPQVRWTLMIRYGGEDRWRLECVQPGGRQSRRGIFGEWSDAQQGDLTPNGPVWFWNYLGRRRRPSMNLDGLVTR